MHIDVNNAFLSWTAVNLLNNGYKYDIRDSYAVIGGDESKRAGVVLASSNLCKKRGVTAGETLYQARKRCPAIRVFPPNYNLYQEMSHKLFSYIRSYTPDIEIYSIDECFLDYTTVKNLYGEEIQFANKLKEEIYNKFGFTVNIGIGNNKLTAKMASELKKPNLVHTIYDYEVSKKMWPLPIEKLFGVGRRTAPIMRKMGINTIGDLAHYDELKLSKIFKNKAFKYIESAKGIDNTEVIIKAPDTKGISKTMTLIKDISNKEAIFKIIAEIANDISLVLRQQKRYAFVVVIIIRDQSFNNKTHQIKLKNPTNSSLEISRIAQKLFIDAWDLTPIRLIGVRLEALTYNNDYQLSLFEDVTKRENDITIEKVIDDINIKYGSKVIKSSNSE